MKILDSFHIVAAILSTFCFLGLGSAHAQTNILEDFESYNVASGQYLDPASVAGSGWSRTGADHPDPQIAKADYDVHCCSGNLPPPYWNDTFDGSDKFLVLRRSEGGLTGELPFKGDNPAALMHQIMNLAQPDPRQFNPKIPKPLVTILNRTLEKEKEKRYQKLTQMAAHLRELGKRMDAVLAKKKAQSAA